MDFKPKFRQYGADLWSAVGPGDITEQECVNVVKIARGKWNVVCFDRDGIVIDKLPENCKVDAFAVASAWLTLDPQVAARAGRARRIAYELPDLPLT